MFNINSMVDFANGSIIISVIVRTIYLIRDHIKFALMTDEDEEEYEKEVAKLEEDLDNQAWKLNIIFPGSREGINDLIEWINEHSILKTIVGYIFCLVPIVNLIITLFNLKLIFED